MKIITLYLITSIIIFSSCSVLTSPKYTKVEKIIKLEEGMTITEVTTTLGLDPYDVLHIQKDGTTLLLYYYKHKERDIGKFQKDNEASLTQGRKIRYVKPSRLYVLFDDDQKLQSVYSEAGLQNSPFIVRTDQILHRINSVSNNFAPLGDTALFWYQPLPLTPENESTKKRKK